ncbi:MAG: transglutaminase domain-containing protein [Treponema sp.]|nr:transglutaminase domain-containing protein [Candidatus Treponema equi]
MKNRITRFLAFCAVLLCSLPSFSQSGVEEEKPWQLIFNADFFYDVPVQDGSGKEIMGELDYGYGVGGGVEIRPWKYLGIPFGVEYHKFKVVDDIVEGYDTITGKIGVGARIPLRGALSLNADLYGGLFSTSHGSISYSGIDYGARVSFRYNFTPSFGIGLGSGYSAYKHDDFPMGYVPLSAGVSFNLTEFQSTEQRVTCDLGSLDPVFPALWAWYDKNGFGNVIIENKEAEDITNVRVFFLHEKFTSGEKNCGKIARIAPGKTGVIDLKARFNPSILTNNEQSNTMAKIRLEYYRLGKQFSVEQTVSVPVYTPNNMAWKDDRMAAVFVSRNNSVTVEFAKYVASCVRPLLNSKQNENLQFAKALFGALSEYGLRYIIDVNSSFAAKNGSDEIDSLNFPHQTLQFKAGDCDDLSILYCSLLESIGIESAFITVPGHIFAAVSLDMSEEEGRKVYSEDEAVFYDGKTWIPVEVTMTQDSFAAARKYGMNEWNKYAAQDQSKIYPMHRNWDEFGSVNVSTEGFSVKLPARERIQARFQN